MRQAEMVETGRTPAEVRLRLGVVCGALAGAAYALTQALSLPLLPTLLLICSFGPLLAIGSAGLWELLRLHHRTATLDIGLVANLAAGITVTLMLLAQLGLKAWFDTGLGGSSQQVSPEVAQVAFQAGNGLQLGLDMAWDVFLAIGTAMLAWNMRQHPRFGPAYAATGLLLAVALIGFNLAAFPENPGRAGLVDVGPLVGAWYLWVTLRMAASLRWAHDQRRATARHQEVVSQRLEPAGAHQRTGQVQERRQEVGAALIADRQPPVGQQPGQRPLHLPAVATQPGIGLHPPPVGRYSSSGGTHSRAG